MADDNEDFVIVLRGRTSKYALVPVIIRLRRLLKIAWRGFGLRCIDIRAIRREPAVVPPSTAVDERSAGAEGDPLADGQAAA